MIPRPSVLGRVGHWLLRLDVGGRVFRFADAPLAITRASGVIDRWSGGLDELEVGERDSSVAVRLLGGAVDWALLVARGLDLASGRATLLRWYEGQVLEQAEVVRQGRLVDPEYDTIEYPLEFSIVEEGWQDAVVWPTPAMVAGSATWPKVITHVVADPAVGQSYPIIIGRPGVAGIIDSPIAGLALAQAGAVSPGLLVEVAASGGFTVGSVLLIAGHEVQAATVRVFDVSDGVSEDRTVNSTTDLLGRTISYVSLDSATTLRTWRDHEYRVAWMYGGGVYNTERTGAMRGVGEVLCYMLGGRVFDAVQQTGTRLDVSRQRAQRAILDDFKIDACINDPISVWSWIQRHLTPIVPMSWVARDAYFQAWRYDATVAHARLELDVDLARLAPDSRIRTPNEEVFNRFVLHYGKRVDGSYRYQRVLTGELAADDGADAYEHYLCRISQQREALRSGDSGVRSWVMRSDVVNDHDVAHRVLLGQARRRAVPPLTVSYLGGTELEAYHRGDVVLLSHAARYWSRRVALVKDVVVGGPQVRIELEVLADPNRNTRRTT